LFRDKGQWSKGQGKDARFGKGLWFGCIKPLEIIVVEARIESRFQTLDNRASIFEFLASIRALSPLNNISFNLYAKTISIVHAYLAVGRSDQTNLVEITYTEVKYVCLKRKSF
jgi:hypothetical protein